VNIFTNIFDGLKRFYSLIISETASSFYMLSLLAMLVSSINSFPYPLLVWLCVVNFATFDILGFSMARKVDKFVTVYRVLQVGYQLMLCHYLFSETHEWSWVLGFLWLWWWGVCDMLYYFIGDAMSPKALWNAGNFYWLWWTPYGFISRLFHKTPSGAHLITFSVLSSIAYALYLMYS